MLDAILLVVVGVFMLRGLLRGVIREAVGLVALLVAGIAATVYAGPAGRALVAREVVRPELAPLLGGSGVFLAAYLAATVLGLVLDRLARALLLGPLLRLAGMIFGALKASVLLGLALIAGQRAVPSLLTPAQLAASRLARPMMGFAVAVLDLGGDWIGATTGSAGGSVT